MCYEPRDGRPKQKNDDRNERQNGRPEGKRIVLSRHACQGPERPRHTRERTPDAIGNETCEGESSQHREDRDDQSPISWSTANRPHHRPTGTRGTRIPRSHSRRGKSRLSRDQSREPQHAPSRLGRPSASHARVLCCSHVPRNSVVNRGSSIRRSSHQRVAWTRHARTAARVVGTVMGMCFALALGGSAWADCEGIALPPPRYDHIPTLPFEVRNVDFGWVARLCGARHGAPMIWRDQAMGFAKTVQACSWRGDAYGTVIRPVGGGWSDEERACLLRHEFGHLNGWSERHEDANYGR